MRGDRPKPDLGEQLADLKKKMAGSGNSEDNPAPISEKPPVQPPTPVRPRGKVEARQRLKALCLEQDEGIPADLPEGQPEITEEQVRRKLAELGKGVKSDKKKRKKPPKKPLAPPPGEPGDDVLRDMARRGHEEAEATKRATRDLRKTGKRTRSLLDRLLGCNK